MSTNNHELGLNMRAGINYCAPKGKLGFRGIHKKTNLARLIPLSEGEESKKEIFYFFGVDVLATNLPYIPDMGPDSDFYKKGFWHHYEIERGIFIDFLTQADGESFHRDLVLQAVHFKGEAKPRIFQDDRKTLLEQGIITPVDMSKIDDLLREKQINLS